MVTETARIAKIIASRGYCSRRQAEALISEGNRVKLEGQFISSPALNCPVDAHIEIDSITLATRPNTRLWLYHKPRGLITTHSDPKGRQTVFAEVKKLGLPRVISVGRLDYNSEGLLLLTNNGQLAEEMMRPNKALEREYLVRSYRQEQGKQRSILDKAYNATFEINGENFTLKSCVLEKATGKNIWHRVILCEGKNREIRKIFEYHGLQVNKLIRVRYGKYTLGDLPLRSVQEVKI